MKFTSIRNKLISRVSLILILSFVGVLSVVGFINVKGNEQSLEASEESIRAALIAKGRTLVRNNSQALSGMVEDYAFTAVQELVSSTVVQDDDIVYGIFMDIDRQPWVNAHSDNEAGTVEGGTELDDPMTEWANELTELDYKITNFNNEEVYEFAAPVTIEDEVSGHIRYALTTTKMKQSLSAAKISAQEKLVETLLIVLGVGVAAFLIGFIATRQMAKRITTPLGTLQEAADTIAGGDYEAEVAVDSDDEIGLLAQNFDSMRLTIQKKMQDLSELNSTGEVLATLLDQHKALEIVLRTMHDHCKVKQGSVYLFNDKDELEIKAFYPPRQVTQERKAIVFKIGEGILGKSAQERKIIYVNDTSNNQEFIESSESARALLCIPLLDKDVLLGVMNFSGSVGEVDFTDSDYEYAESIARLLVITIKNIRMREVIEEQNRTLEQKVAQRTAALQEKTNDILSMMQNMHQGLFTIMDGCLIHHEYAAFLETIFETKRIAQRNFMDLLFANATLGNNVLDQVNTAINALLGEDEMMWDFNAHMLVKEYTCRFDDGREKIVELDWDPIVLDGTIDKIMVTVRDVTELKALQAAAEDQKRELEIIGHILALEPAKFASFVTSARDFFARCRTLITDTANKDQDVIAELFRNMHTVKGNARTYGFTYITDSVHDVESSYDELRKEEAAQWDQARLLAELDKAEADLERYDTVAREKLGRSADSTGGESVTVDRQAVEAVLAGYRALELGDLPDTAQQCLTQAYRLAVSLSTQPLADALSGVIGSLDSLAGQLDKPVPAVTIEAPDIHVQTRANELLENVFMHLMRNAIDHGIEPPDERTGKGKSAAGNILITTNTEQGQLRINISDDGRGLALDKLKAKGLENGLLSAENADPQAIAELIFASGFSTAQAVSDVSGRGVGMDAVREFLREQGGDIRIELTGTPEQGFCPFRTEVTLPETLFVVNAQ